MLFIETYEAVITGLEEKNIDTSPLRAIAFLSCCPRFIEGSPTLFGSSAMYWVRLITHSSPEKIIELYIKKPPHDIDIYFENYFYYSDVYRCLSTNLFAGIKVVNTLSPLNSSMPRSIAVAKIELEINILDYLAKTNAFICNPLLKIGKKLKFNILVDLVFIRVPIRSYRFLDEIFEVNLQNFSYTLFLINKIQKKKDICVEQELLTSIKMTQKSLTDFNFVLLNNKLLVTKFFEYIDMHTSDILIFEELDKGNRYYTNPYKLPIGITCWRLVSSDIEELIQNVSNYWIRSQRDIMTRLRQYKFEYTSMSGSSSTIQQNVCKRTIKQTKEIILSHWALNCKSPDDILKKTKKIIENCLTDGVYSISDANMIDVKSEDNKKLTIGICSCGHPIIVDDILPFLLTEIKEISQYHYRRHRTSALNKAVLNCPLCQSGEITNISQFSMAEKRTKKRIHHGGNVFMIGDDLQQSIQYYKKY
tara:strand:+ start:390 stop:1817 length:1428 start_codon:yes stop_codon:yes gene_type:complete